MLITLRTLQVYRVMRIRSVSYAVEAWIHVVHRIRGVLLAVF